MTTQTVGLGVDSAYEAVIGLEVHAQLLTRSKMFCSCSAAYTNAPANGNCCPVCLGMPGVLPVMNRQAVEMTVRTALALDCEIPAFTKFDRKNYFYPDLPKGYQISQYDLPMSLRGHLDFTVNEERARCGITRVHLEEDTGTMHHAGDVLQEATSSLVDLNRSGVPLMEIVSEPDLRSADAAREYLVRLRQLLMYIGVNDGNLEQGSLRCDANVSVRKFGVSELGTKVEVKNMNSFRAVHRAIDFEIARQVAVLEQGGALLQETRGWVETRAATVSQRSKEMAHDYRYFPEPDLPPLQLGRELVERIRSELPELPEARAARLAEQYGLSTYDAALLTASREDADAYEELVDAGVSAKVAANWQMGDVAALANQHHRSLVDSGVGVVGLATLLRLLEDGTINGPTAKELLAELYEHGGDAALLVRERGLGQVSDRAALTVIVDEVIAANAQACEDFRGGKAQALGRLVGQVMKAAGGRAEPALVNSLLRERLSA
ncbi:MAG: Asp-tRNA(Asn)/Glu-tRNA(Gln) amidotransferase subunit GatB [Candidatus Dormibacteraeota bacterium]|uniref:Aspartyl/glutamyl-tRNA(Asn/Gln) amidotransferase subunit B n=1 Tax=Candidatus Amunia macphersoniae TaxID=3127014 RepID=A0A934KK39_9BACT|nr:Asp-tRNA(Asn)/Glu-tRNA(Gln) amidotransferase subunit GatB [Candidatus Dormibacteraeota bacterium]